MLKTFLTKIKAVWQTKNKENTINIKTGFRAIFPILLIALGVISLGAVRSNGHTTQGIFDISAQLDSIDSASDYESLSSIGNLEDSGLPIAGIKKYEVENASGTAIFIPQIHKNPGSESRDKSNDAAEVTQGQIYEITELLNDKYGIDLVVVEGELNGLLSADKFIQIAKKVKERNFLALHLGKLKDMLSKKSLDPKLENRLVQSLSQTIKDIDREIILQGAPYKLKAEGKNLTFYGTEVESTREEGKVIVRDYIYLNDRIQSLENTQVSRTSQTQGLFPANVLDLLKNFSSKRSNTISRDMDSLKSLAEEEDDKQLITTLEDLAQDLTDLKSGSKTVASASQSPAREDNPYKSETNLNKLKELLKDTEKKIEKTVINQRNREAAESFAEALSATKEKTGILQFGAGHEKGLIEELNKQGISVIVITPDKVAKR